MRRPAQAISLYLQATPRDPHRPDHRRADLRFEDGLLAPRLPLRAEHVQAPPRRPRRRECASRRSAWRPCPTRQRRSSSTRSSPPPRRPSGPRRPLRGRRASPRRRLISFTWPRRTPWPTPSSRCARLPVRPCRSGRHARLRPQEPRLPRRRGRASRPCSPGSRLLNDALAASGGIDPGQGEASRKAVVRRYSATPFVYDPVPPPGMSPVRRPSQSGGEPRGVPVQPRVLAARRALMMLFKRLREIDVPEMMAEHHRRDEGEALGLLPGHVAPRPGTRPGTR